MRVALYARVSTSRPAQAQTIEQQLERLQAHVHAQSETVAEQDVFRDAGYSRARLSRPELDQLRDRVALAEFDRVVVTAPDRLARKYVHQVLLIEERHAHGCTVDFVERPMSQDPHDQLLLQIRGAVAEYERTLVCDRMRRGRLTHLRAGQLLPWSRAPFGYLLDSEHPRDPASLHLDSAAAAVVQQMFARYLEAGATVHSIALRLTRAGILTPTGKPRWNVASVRGILKNPAYTGTAYGNRARMVSASQRKSALLRPVVKMARQPGRLGSSWPTSSALASAIIATAATVWAPTASSRLSGASRCGSCTAFGHRCRPVSRSPAIANARWSKASSLRPSARAPHGLPGVCPSPSTFKCCCWVWPTTSTAFVVRSRSLLVEGCQQSQTTCTNVPIVFRFPTHQAEYIHMEPMSTRKAYQYRMKPTPEQARALEAVLHRCRTLYNVALEQRKAWWGRGQGIGATYYQQATELPDLKAACPEYADVHSQVLQDVLRRVDKTYRAFFQRVATGETPGYPRFQSTTRYHSFTYPQYGNGAVLDGSILSLSKIGRIPRRMHRSLAGTPKTVTVSREADDWYVSISCADVPTQPLSCTGNETGIDVGLKVFLVTADGEVVRNPRHHRKAEKQLAKAQRRVSRRTKGSKRWCKAVSHCARKYQQVRRQRRDFHHKTALALVRQYDVIYSEDLQVRNLSRRPAPRPDGNGGYLPNGAKAKSGLNKSINDAGWYAFRVTLACKAAWAGKRVEAIPPAYTTQECSNILLDGTRCGERVRKSLRVRTHVCPTCGYILDRDVNAAKNILWAGQALRGVPALVGALNREAPSL
jgi:IS605 OrfB family transposase